MPPRRSTTAPGGAELTQIAAPDDERREAMSPARQCIVCEAPDAEPLYRGLLKCRQCAYVFADLRVSDEELATLYDGDYFCGGEYDDYLSEKRIIQKNFAARFRVLRPFLRPERHRRLLEIGCAYGFFLDVVRDRFDSVRGIDVAEAGVRYAAEELGLDVVRGDFLKHDFGDDKFDMVCMWDTIEHLRSPHLYLRKLSRHMEAGSLLALTTGDVESLNARLRGERWRLIHPPTHAHYFSPQTLARLLDKHGYDVVYNRYCGFFRSVGRAPHNVLVLRHQKPQLFDVVRRFGVADLNFYLNLYDIMYVIARRR